MNEATVPPENPARKSRNTNVVSVNSPALAEVFGPHRIDVVIHFAAKKSVPESTQIPLEYFDINLAGTINVLRAMRTHGVRRLVYSSSCSVYGDAQQRPLTESDKPCPTNPYAWTKWTCEQVIDQACRVHPELVTTSLRYFNPIGAHQSGTLGEAARRPGVQRDAVAHAGGVRATARIHDLRR